MSSKEDKEEEKTFLEKNKDFVLTLRLVGVGGTPQIRRVRLSRIAADNDEEGEEGAAGGISFDKLIKLAISQTFPGAPLEIDDYNVALTYYDVDNDCVTIASTEELVDAIEQYSDTEPPVLRLTTDVKRTNTNTKKSVNNKKNNRSNNNRPVVSPVGRFADASPAGGGGGPQVQIQNALESFVTVLASAVIALQEKVNLPPPPSPDVASSRSSSSVNSSSTRTATDDNGTEVGAVATTTAKKTAAASSSAPSDSKEDDDDTTKENSAAVQGDNKIRATSTTKNGDEQQQKRRPFIHGRHTCDGCLCTPIVGTRYNAVNLPDYDLCANCYNNYKGTEIQFETAELDRDRPFQERWHRRRARWSGGRGHCSSGGGGGARHHGRRHHNRRSKNKEGSSRSVQPVPSRHPAGPAPSELDAALKEAIRRSLKEEADDNADATTTTKKEAVVVVDEAKSPPPSPPAVEEDDIEEERLVEKKETTEPAVDESDVIEDTKDCLAKTEAAPPSDEEKNQTTTTTKSGGAAEETFSSAAAGSGDVAEALGQTLDECAKAIDGIMTELVRDENKSNDDNDIIVVDDDDDSVDGDDVEKDIVADDDDSVPSPPVEDEGEMHNNDDGEEDVSAMTCSVPSVLVDSVRDVDVAVIDEKTSPSPDVANEVDDTADTDAVEDEESDNAGGATILDSVDQTDEGDVNEDEDASNASGESDEWQVVKEDGEITTNDEIQARAFQMVGSSLFDSQMSTGTDGGAEVSSAPTEISDPPSSVPSNITSIVGDDARSSSATPAVAALARWAPQLAQLRELGFDNESECVDVLEKLFAANVGVDSDEEVTVTQVVEELLKDSN